MLKLIIVLVVGLCLGYFLGFADSKKHDDTVVTRVVHRIGLGGGAQSNDIDAKMKKAGGN